MLNQLLETVLKALLGAAIPASITFLTLWLKQKKENKLCVSSGLATGYYYNFIKGLFEEAKISVNLDTGSVQEFDTSTQVTLEIIIPSKLDDATIKIAERFAAKGNKTGIISRGTKRPFTIFYNDNNNAIKIVDAANPINALSLYVDNLKEYKGSDTTTEDKLAKKQIAERDNFKKTIINLYSKKGYGNGKISFRNEKGEPINA
jgi:hypothetical protein